MKLHTDTHTLTRTVLKVAETGLMRAWRWSVEGRRSGAWYSLVWHGLAQLNEI